jgi:hypothetical protein
VLFVRVLKLALDFWQGRSTELRPDRVSATLGASDAGSAATEWSLG